MSFPSWEEAEQKAAYLGVGACWNLLRLGPREGTQRLQVYIEEVDEATANCLPCK